MNLRRCLLLTCLCLSVAVLAQLEYQHGVLVLTDGRTIAIRGEIEVLGDEVQFTDGRGELMMLPLESVDLAATRKRNDEIRNKSSVDAPVVKDGSLYSEVANYQAQKKKDGEDKDGVVIENLEPAKRARPSATKTLSTVSESTLTQIKEIPTLNFMDQQQAEEWMRQFQDKMSQAPGFALTLVIAAVLLAIFALISFFTQIYLVVISFREGFLWWFSLLACFLGPVVLNVTGWALGATNMIFTLGPFYLNLLSLVVFPAFIFTRCHGRRFKLFMLYALYLIWLVICIVAFVAWLLLVP